MIRVLAFALLCTVGTIAPATADDIWPNFKADDILYPELKGVTLATYNGVAEVDKSRCATDMDTWNTSIDFVANQSTKLQLLSRRAVLNYPDTKKFAVAPWLLFSIMTMETTTGCAGTVGARVTVMLERSTIIATGKVESFPFLTIWSDQRLLTGPSATFSSLVIRTSEQIMKKFVNDWAKVQGQ
jgi:hypothetical protein